MSVNKPKIYIKRQSIVLMGISFKTGYIVPDLHRFCDFFYLFRSHVV